MFRIRRNYNSFNEIKSGLSEVSDEPQSQVQKVCRKQYSRIFIYIKLSQKLNNTTKWVNY
jgi:hypothetical protein